MVKKNNKASMKPFHDYKKLKLLPKLKIHEKIISAIFKLFGYGIGMLTCLPWMLINRLTIKPEANRQQSFSYEENDEKIYRRLEAKDGLAATFRGTSTVTEILLKVLKEGGKRSLMGYRQLIKEHIMADEYAKKSFLELGGFEWISCNEVLRRIMTTCEYLKSLNLNQDRKIGIFAETSQDWIVFAFAVIFLNSVFVTVYPTLTDDNIFNAFNLTEPVAILVDPKTSGRLNTMLDRLPSIETIIYTTRCQPNIVTNSNPTKHIHVHLDSVFERTIEIEQVISSLVASRPDDLIIIMFTSGSTGIPKGIMIKHRNIISVMAGCESQRQYWEGETLIGYLPLAHILEISCEMAIILFGGRIGYGNPGTLFPNGPILYKDTLNDLAALQPTCMAVVPMLMERVYKGFNEKLQNVNRIKKLILQESYNLKAYFHSRGFETPIINRMILKKFHSLFGGKLKYAMVGGSYLPPDLEEFFNIMFPPFKQAYGTTEICCAGTMSNISYHRPYNIGPPLACSEIKLQTWVEGGYTESGVEITKGEILVSGASVCCGYYKNQDETNQAFFTDPVTNKFWYRTSDIGEILPDGCFRIIGRKSEIIKLSHGEFVELPKIEAVISSSKYVDFVCTTPNQNRNALIAIVSLNITNVKQLAKALKISDDTKFELLATIPDIIDEIKNEIELAARKALLSKFEIPKSYIFTSDQWNPDSGLLTPSFKIKRSPIVAKYINEL